MKRITLLSTTLALAVALPAFTTTAAAHTESAQHKAAKEKCEKEAKEHKVSHAHMRSYLHQCISKEMKKTESHAKKPAEKPATTK